MDQMILSLRAVLAEMYNFEGGPETPLEHITCLAELRMELPEMFEGSCSEPAFVVALFRTVIDYEIERYSKELVRKF